MPISRIVLRSDFNYKTVELNLNTIQKGWVTQIVGGTFGSNNTFNFTDGNLTSIESSIIDINVRMTPVVTITERTPESILEFIAGASRQSEVSILDTDTPGLSIKYTTENNVPTAKLYEYPYSTWSQKCIIRDIKYNYSEKPATIEFTISTTKPYLNGSALDFYCNLNSEPNANSYNQFATIFNRLAELNVYGDLGGLALAVPPNPKGTDRTLSVHGLPYKIFVRSEDNTKPGEVRISSHLDGHKEFSFKGGLNPVISYAYVTDAHPIFSARLIDVFLRTYGNTKYRINSPVGEVSSWIRFVHTKRGL